MHDDYIPHCSYCKHFRFCLRTDMVIEWGYCCHSRQAGTVDDAGFKQELEIIKQEVKEGNFQTLLARSEELGLFVPRITSCPDYNDIYPF